MTGELHNLTNYPQFDDKVIGYGDILPNFTPNKKLLKIETNETVLTLFRMLDTVQTIINEDYQDLGEDNIKYALWRDAIAILVTDNSFYVDDYNRDIVEVVKDALGTLMHTSRKSKDMYFTDKVGEHDSGPSDIELSEAQKQQLSHPLMIALKLEDYKLVKTNIEKLIELLKPNR